MFNIVCALGPWTDSVIDHEHEKLNDRVRTTKGVHIICRGSIGSSALLIPTNTDKRIFFAIPWMGNTLIGTTDTDYKDVPENVRVEKEDVEYLLKEIQRVFPDGQFTKDKIISSFAGLRPLVYQKGQPSQVSRKHKIDIADSGVVYVMGGKYTTFRLIAEDCLKKIMKEPLLDTRKEFPFYGAGRVTQDIHYLSKEYGVPAKTISYLIETYGTKSLEVLALIKVDESLREPICDCSLVIKAQVKYSIEAEMAVKLEDILSRRLSLVYRDCQTKRCQKYIEDLLNK